MAKDYVQKITIDASMQVEGVKKGIADIEKSFASMKFNPAATKGVFESIEKLKNNLAKFEEVSSHSIKNAADSKAFEKSWDNVSKSIDEVNSKLIKLKIDPSKLIDTKVLGKFDELKKKLVEIQQARDTTTTKKDTLSQQVKETGEKVTELQNKINSLKDNKIDVDDEELNKLKQASEEANIELERLRQTKRNLGKDASPEEIGKLNTAITEADAAATKAKKAYKEYMVSMDSDGQMKKLEQELKTQTELQNKYQAELNQTEEELKKLKNIDLSQIKAELTKITGADYKTANVKQLIAEIDRLATEESGKLTPALEEAKVALDQLNNEMKEAQSSGDTMADGVKQTSTEAEHFGKQMNGLQTQMMNFFSLTNGWNLLRRSIRAAVDVVKELDEAMTGMAVVSEYSLGDIWEKRGEFSQSASELGVTTLDLVNATTLYVQQGLALDEAMGVAIETMKMGRIANLEGEEATNLMTAALRGYNMEMTQAAHVNDVYSNLAAKTASDTEELATAMSKTASIAYNSGASFENMSAFLAQIIETTREAPETAGTAMKTIIARFQELKKPLEEIGEVEGEVVDANKIEGALRLAGVALRDAKGEFRDFDDVILELSGKWNSLDKMTQRYIATMAAGSRQQSRFLALMNDNKRLLELTGYAADSAGASQQQFDKTLESFQSKLAKFQNALDVFYTNLANNTIVKGFLDIMTALINTINALIQPFADANNIIANFAGALIEVGIIAVAFKVALAMLGATARKTAVAMSGLTTGIVAEGIAAKKSAGATSILGAAFKTLGASIKSGINFIKAIPTTLAQLGAGFKVATASEMTFAAATEAAGNESIAAATKIGMLAGSLTPLLIILAGVAALFAITGIMTWIHNEDVRNAEKLSKELDEIKEKVEESNNQLEETRDLFNGYTEGAEKLSELEKGTEEYNSTLADTNEKAKDLIETLGLFDAYTVDENGLIKIDENKLKQQLENVRQENIRLNTDAYKKEIELTKANQLVSKNDFLDTQAVSYEVSNTNGNNVKVTAGQKKNFENNWNDLMDNLFEQMSKEDYELMKSDEKIEELLDNIIKDLNIPEADLEEFRKAVRNNLPELESLASSSHYSAEQVGYLGKMIVEGQVASLYNDKALRMSEQITGERDQTAADEYLRMASQIVNSKIERSGYQQGTEKYESLLQDELTRVNSYLDTITTFATKEGFDDYGNLQQVILNALQTGSFDSNQLMFGQQELEALKNLDYQQLYNLFGYDMVMLLRQNGVELETIISEIQDLNINDAIASVLAQASGNNKVASNAITDINKGDLTAESYASGEYKGAQEYSAMLTYLESLEDIYPEIIDDAELLRKTWLIGTQEYTEALWRVQDVLADAGQTSLENEINELQEKIDNFEEEHPIELRTKLDEKELKNLQNDLDKKRFELKVAIKMEGRQNINQLEESVNNLTSAFDAIDDNLQVAASDFMDLVDVFPMLAEGIEVLDNGMIQLSEDSVAAAQASGKGQVEAWADAAIAKLEIDQQQAQAEVNYYQALEDAVANALQSQVDGTKDKVTAVNDLEYEMFKAIAKYAVDSSNNQIEAAETTAEAQVQASKESGEKQMSNAYTTATTINKDQNTIAEQSAVSAEATVKSWAQAAYDLNQAFYDNLDSVASYLNNLARSVNKINIPQVKLDPKGEGVVVEYGNWKYDVPTDASIGGNKASKKPYGGGDSGYLVGVDSPGLLSGDVNLQNASLRELAKAIINDPNMANLVKANAAAKKAESQATLDSLNAQIATIQAIKNKAIKNLEDKTAKADKGGNGGGGGGGGGSDKEEKKWIQDYDWMYNTLQQINKLIRDRNKLEREYSKLTSNQREDSEKLLNLRREELINIQRQIRNQEILQARRLEEINALEEYYSKYQHTDENGKNVGKPYNFLDLAHYDTDLGYTVIDYEKIAAVSGVWPEEVGKIFEQYVKKLEDLQKDIEGIEDSIADNQDLLDEIASRGRDEFLQLEKDTISALEETREREIERLEKINEAIDEGNQAVIDKLQQGISDYREGREQDKALQDINDQERRLALMMTDTSGANQLDILNAQKTLDDARQSYTDSLIDKSIEEMSRQAEEAAAQRDRQIALMKDQFEEEKKSGQIAEQAKQIIAAAFESPNGMKSLRSLLQDVDGYQAMGFMTQEEWNKNFLTTFEKAREYSKGIKTLDSKTNENFVKQNAGKEITFTDKNGKTRTGSIQSDGSVLFKGTSTLSAGRKTLSAGTWQKATGVYQDINGNWKQDSSGKNEVTKIANERNDIIDPSKSYGNTVEFYDGNNQLVKGTTQADGTVKVGSGKDQTTYTLYMGLRNGKAILYGVSQELKPREASRKWGPVKGLSNLEEDEARGVAEAINQWGLNAGWGLDDHDHVEHWFKLTSKFSQPVINRIQEILKKFKEGATSRQFSDPALKNYRYSAFATGGLADFTGPAWLDGTKSKPEYILNADQTQRFFDLLDFTKDIGNNDNSTLIGDTYYNISMSNEISSDYDVDSMWDEMQRKIYENAGYRNVQSLDFGRR